MFLKEIKPFIFAKKTPKSTPNSVKNSNLLGAKSWKARCRAGLILKFYVFLDCVIRALVTWFTALW